MINIYQSIIIHVAEYPSGALIWPNDVGSRKSKNSGENVSRLSNFLNALVDSPLPLCLVYVDYKAAKIS